MKETSTIKLWKTVKDMYMMKRIGNKLYFKKKIYIFIYAPDMLINDHVNSFNKILADLLNLDKTFGDKDKALSLLDSLLDEYDHLTTTLLYRKDKVIFNVVCSALYNYETRKNDRKDHSDIVTEALVARGHSRSHKPIKKGKSKGRSTKNECTFCCLKLQKNYKGKAIFDACAAEHDAEELD